ncbi:hypothetical protein GCM10010466_08750 [Planomonospora alba]|uniref:Uncharacterized protein n=1 Tax=Planomonospora alba TaxID=161354 RepID=A0ABP6MN26_9ACTN
MSITSLPWPVFLLAAWFGTVLVISYVVCAIAKAAINKADARDLPNVLTALAQVLRGIVRPLSQAFSPAQSSLDSPASAQDGGSPEQTNGQGGEPAGIGR